MFPHSSSPIFIYTNTPHTVTFTLSLHDALPIWPGRERGEEAVELGEGHAAGRGTVGGEEGAERLEPRADGIDPRRAGPAGRPPLVRGARLVPHRTAPSPRCTCPGMAPIEVHLDLLPRKAGFSPEQRSGLAYPSAVPPHLCGITISHCVLRCLLNTSIN